MIPVCLTIQIVAKRRSASLFATIPFALQSLSLPLSQNFTFYTTKIMIKNLLFGVILLTLGHFASAQNYNMQLRSSLTFPGQTLANICGYWQDGREYALVGGSKGLIIVDITAPESPQTLIQIPGPDNLWKEIKVYKNYAYVTSEGGQGVQIVNLKNLPNTNLEVTNYKGSGTIEGRLNRIHALHIDVTKGYLYTYGSSDLSQGGGSGPGNGAVVHDLNKDPFNPSFVGYFQNPTLGYVHDGYADNDTLYAAHINNGFLSIVDFKDKNNPKLLGQIVTPAAFTHNSWITKNRKTILTTDERTASFVTAYDVSDPFNIKELDRIATGDGNSSIGHNTHVIDDWTVTSWYTDGLNIVDAHRPQNLIQVGYYDTWPQGTGASFDGCWGAFPYFPSGTIIASNIEPAELFVLTPKYQRACYLEGKITNGCTGLPMAGAEVRIKSTDHKPFDITKGDGSFKTGQLTPGKYDVVISKAGFAPKTVQVELKTAEVTPLEATLGDGANLINAGLIFIEKGSTKPISNKNVSVKFTDQTVQKAQTDASGKASLVCIQTGKIRVGSWGYLDAELTIGAAGNYTVELEKGYYDDFGLDLGWTTSSTANSGFWVREKPNGTLTQGQQVNPGDDSNFDINTECYVTGNNPSTQASTDDVDGGEVTLLSPIIDLTGYDDAILSFDYWFFNGGGSGSPNDRFEVRLINDGVSTVIFKKDTSASAWRSSGDLHLKNFITGLNNNKLQIQFWTADLNPGHLVEAGADIFKLTPIKSPSGVQRINKEALLSVSPNPSASSFVMDYNWPVAGPLYLEVSNALGQIIEKQTLAPGSGNIVCGESWPKGIYFARLRHASQGSLPLRLVKQ